MTLGSRTFSLIARTIPPAIGLLILIGTYLLVVFLKVSITNTSSGMLLIFKPSLVNSLSIRDGLSTRKEISEWTKNVRQNSGRRPRRPESPVDVNRLTPQAELPGSRDGPKPPPKGASNMANQIPYIANPIPGQSQAGVGGVPIQGELFPPTRAQTAPMVVQRAEKKVLTKGEKLKISNPVMRESRGLQLSQKMAMVDLDTARKNDEEKRQAQQNAWPLNTVPAPAALSQDILLTKPAVFKRKEVGSPALAPVGSMTLRQASEAITSATQLSPGAGDLRLRSPRQSAQTNQTQQTISQRLSPTTASESRNLPHIASMIGAYEKPQVISPPQQPLVYTKTAPSPTPSPTRRSRSGSVSPKKPNGGRAFTDPNKPPPIPSALMQVAKIQLPASKDQSPSPLVPRVEPLAILSPPKSGTLSMPRSYSVRNDIRPSRNIKSPLPPIEEPPKTAVQMRPVTGIPGNPKARRMLNKVGEGDTSRDQAIMFANAAVIETDAVTPPSANIVPAWLARESVLQRPRPIPRKKSLYPPDFTAKVSPSAFRHRRSLSAGSIDMTRSKRSSRSSRSSKLTDIPAFPSPPKSAGPRMSTFELNVYSPNIPNIAELPAQSVSPPVIPEKSPLRSSNLRAAASPLSTPKSSTAVEISIMDRQPSVKSQKSMHSTKRRSSSVLPIGVLRSLSMMGDVHTHSRGNSEPADMASSSRNTPNRGLSPNVGSPPEERRPTPPAKDAAFLQPAPAPRAIRPRTEEMKKRPKEAPSLTKSSSWHRRVGEACPSFSDRIDGASAQRKQLAPKPLRLNHSMKPIMIEAEPSPIESPQHALNLIQEQLARLESLEEEEKRREQIQQQRKTLLESLEHEMDAQESQWQQMRQSLARRSIGLRSSYDTNSGPASSVQSPQATPLQGKASIKSPQANQSLQRSNSNGRMTLLSVSSKLSQLSSPTPPDSEESGSEYDDDLEFEMIRPSKSTIIAAAAEKLSGGQNPTASHWSVDSATTGGAGSAARSPFTSEHAAVQSQDNGPPRYSLPPRSPENSNTSPTEPSARPRTLKPPRKSRRMTQLPDIPESPTPLANKRGTLGIFKFPSGEISDIATLPKQDPMTILRDEASDIPLAQPVALPQQPILTSQALPGSFFDHYEEEDEGDNFSERGGSSNGDDDFDEMTLWEIANLLKSDKIPSRDSLLPQHPESRALKSPEPKDFDGPSGLQEDSMRPIALALDFKPRAKQSQAPALWVGKSRFIKPKAIGLAQPDTKVWQAHLSIPKDIIRSKPRFSKPDTITSVGLWSSAPPPKVMGRTLWVPKEDTLQTGPKYGIAQPDEAAWNTYIVAPITRSKSTRRPAPAAKIRSSVLWTTAPKKPEKGLKPALWIGSLAEKQVVKRTAVAYPSSDKWRNYTKDVPPRSRSRSVPRTSKAAIITSSSLWDRAVKSEPASPILWSQYKSSSITTKYLGVAQPDDAEWKTYMSMPYDQVRAVLRKSEPAAVTSTSLWVSMPDNEADDTTEVSSLWDSPLHSRNTSAISQAFPDVEPRSVKTTPLWAAPTSAPAVTHGLPQHDQFWESYTLGSKPNLSANLRLSKVQPIESSSLWNAAPAAPSPSDSVESKLWSGAASPMKCSHGKETHKADKKCEEEEDLENYEEPAPAREEIARQEARKTTLWFPW